MSDNVNESSLKRCFEEIASPMPTITRIEPRSPYRQPAKRRNLNALLTDVPKTVDVEWLDANVMRRYNYPKRTERDAAVELASRKMERDYTTDSAWSILKNNVEFNIIQDVMESLFKEDSKGK